MNNLEKWNQIVQAKTNDRLKVLNVTRERVNGYTKTLLTAECQKHPGEIVQFVRGIIRNKNLIKCPKCLLKVAKDKGYARTLKAIKSQILNRGDSIDFSKIPNTKLNKHTCYDVRCKLHNIWYKTTFELIQKGHGHCPICTKIKRRESKVLANNVYISRLKERYGDKYDLSNVSYDGRLNRVKLKCKIHNIWFNAFPGNTLKKTFKGCPKCHLEWSKEFNTKTTDYFISKSKKIHGDKYDYSKSVYKSNSIPIEIICKKHGPFFQVPSTHYSGSGCPSCKSSKGENKIVNFLLKFGIKYYKEYRLNKNYRFRYDFYLPDYNILIEYHGEQHYKNVNWFKGTTFEKRLEYDKKKVNLARTHHVDLIVIPYTKFEFLEDYLCFRLSKFYKYYYNGKFFKNILNLAAYLKIPNSYDLRNLLQYKTVYMFKHNNKD